MITLLSLRGFANRRGLAFGTVRRYYVENRLPEPDGELTDGTDISRPGWLAETIDNWQRPGQGARTDLQAKNAQRSGHSREPEKRMTDHEPPKRGQEFTHASFQRQLPDGRQGFAVMKVTAVRRGEVFYTYADSPTNKGDWRMPIENWIKRYGTAASRPE